ncbi:hypothetical protein KP509_33G056800 [Ceratopteris richardii]|uniref:C3H1-type domain-containing protein n=1 Tax=Ceratopteris richardii TaxID=49495 RepID=A0A8T2QQD5_CERRI|nr:hypothetical protein KP509_33G056800 [Ceratopteris richardii]
MPTLLHEPLRYDPCTFSADSSTIPSPHLIQAVAYTLQACPGFSFLPSNNDNQAAFGEAALFSSDDFRIYEFKVRRCMRGRSHDWTECPFAHPGEKARRRDPRRIHYSGSPCPDFRKGTCRRGDACEFSHGVFECWLHPARYRTQVCKDGENCKRKVCFFAHSPEQLRMVPVSTVHLSPVTSVHNREVELASSVSHHMPEPYIEAYRKKISSNEPSTITPVSLSGGRHFMLPSSSASVMPRSDNIVGPSESINMSNASFPQNVWPFEGYGVSLDAAQCSSIPRTVQGISADDQLIRMLYSDSSQSGSKKVFVNYNSLLEQTPSDVASWSYGYASPTSTLEGGNILVSPPISPPHSPSSSFGNKITKTFTHQTMNSCSVFADNNIIMQNDTIELPYGRNGNISMEDLQFHLQHFQIEGNSEACTLRNIAVPQRSIDERLPQMRSSISQGVWDLRSTSKQELWGISRSSMDSNLSEIHALQTSGACVDDLMVCKTGEDGANIDNLMPDFAWVSDLIK